MHTVYKIVFQTCMTSYHCLTDIYIVCNVLVPGDIGYCDEDGHFVFEDRIKELIKVKGFQVLLSYTVIIVTEGQAYYMRAWYTAFCNN